MSLDSNEENSTLPSDDLSSLPKETADYASAERETDTVVTIAIDSTIMIGARLFNAPRECTDGFNEVVTRYRLHTLYPGTAECDIPPG